MPATPPGTIAPDLVLVSPPDGRTYRRRRLGVLAAVLVVTLAVAGLASGGGDAGPAMVAAGASDPVSRKGVVVGESTGSVTLAAVFEETTDTLVAVTTTTLAGTTTTTTTTTSTATASAGAAAPTTTAAPAPTTAPPATSAAAEEPEESSSSAAARAPATTAPPTTSAPKPAPPATAPPATAAPTTTAAPAPTSSGGSYRDPSSLQVWLDLARCESGGNWSIDSGNGYYGGLQFSLGTWQSVGGSGYPHEHSRDTQIDMGRRLQANAGWGAWPHCSEELGLR